MKETNISWLPQVGVFRHTCICPKLWKIVSQLYLKHELSYEVSAFGNKAWVAIRFSFKKQQPIFPVIMNWTSNSLGQECAAFGSSSRSYCFFDEDKKPTGISSCKFTKSKAEINDWCNLIKRQNGKDGFVVKENSTYICLKHFHAADIYRAPDGTRHPLIKESHPKLDSWITFGEGLSKSRKPPSYRTLTRKKMCLDLTSVITRKIICIVFW